MRWLLLLACAACADKEYDEVVVARWDLADEQAIQIPSPIYAGQPATIRIISHGNSCVSLHSTDVEQADGVVDITPYDRRHSLDGFCEDIERRFEHAAEIVFPPSETNRVLLRIHGSYDERGRVLIERDIVIDLLGGRG